MARFSLSSCIFRLKNSVDNSDINQIDRIVHPDNTRLLDFYNVLNDYFSDRRIRYSMNRREKSFLQLSKFFINDDPISGTTNTTRMYSGVIEHGDFGYGAKLKSASDGSLNYERRVDDAELYPYYFLTWVPKNLSFGLLILGRFKQFGIKTDFNRDLNEYISSAYRDWNIKVEIDDIIPSIVLRDYFNNGRILKLRYIKKGLPRDIADRYNNPTQRMKEGYVELNVCAHRQKDVLNYSKDILQGFLRNEVDSRALFTMMGSEYDNLKVEVELGKSKKTFNMSRVDSARPYIDITEDINYGADGHPDFNSINSEGKDLLNAIKEQLGLRDV